jgi:phage recombination protein Bet
METAIAVKEQMEISVADVKKYIAPNATDKELFMFMGVARSYGLNPLKREIHFVKYGSGAASIIVGYETYLKRAERTGKLDGWKCWIEDVGKPTERAIIEIKRKDQSMPITWEVYRKEFDKQQSSWKSMPTFMLKKVAIAQGFRMAFPDDLGGMPYIPEELPATEKVTSESLAKHEADVPDFAPVEAEADNEPPMPEPMYEVESSVMAPPPNEPEENIHVIKVSDVQVVKTGEKNGKKWSKFQVTSATGSKYSTFSKSIADRMEAVKASGDMIPIRVKETKFGNEIEAVVQ